MEGIFEIIGLIVFAALLYYGYKWGKKKSQDKYKK